MRPQYGDALRFDRVLNVFFYTSNTDKLLQARLMFARRGYSLRHFKSRNEPYDEDYTFGTEELLARALRQVQSEFGIRSLFFVEDTSLRIEALSRTQDYPGLAVKEWFASTSFVELDRQLSSRKKGRRAIVKSDIALYIPTLSHPIFCHGETVGKVANSPPTFEPSAQYPWLTPATFNGWFIPDGSSRRLGEMEFEESLDFDFRAKSLSALIARVQEMNAALNLTPNFYTVRKAAGSATSQLPLVGGLVQVLLVIGPKCAGKTTMSNHLVGREDVHPFEASAVLRDLAYEAGETIVSSDDAIDFLRRRGMDVVARRISAYIERLGYGLNIVTGLRTVEELLFLCRQFPEARIIFVDSDSLLRFERHIRRARDQEVKTYKDFEQQDQQQLAFGALRVANDLASAVLLNDGSIEQYKLKIDELVGALAASPVRRRMPEARESRQRADSELHRCLRALKAIGRIATCDEIAAKTADLGGPVRRYNTNRALKDVPEFAERTERPGQLLSYKLTDRGCRLLELLDEVAGRRWTPPSVSQERRLHGRVPGG